MNPPPAASNLATVANNAVEKISNGMNVLHSDAQQIIAWAKANSPQAWDVLVTQVKIEGYTNIAYLVIGIIAGITTFYMLKKAIAKMENDPRKESAYIPTYIVSAILGVLSAITLIYSIATIDSTVSKIVNPEYHAAIKVARIAGIHINDWD